MSDDFKEWLASPEGVAWEKAEAARAEARKRGDLRFLSLTDRRREDGFSLQMTEVDRVGARALRDDGYVFDAETNAWMDEQ